MGLRVIAYPAFRDAASSETTLRIGNIIGHIELMPIASLPQWLPSPTSTTNNIPPRSDFHIILVQKFPEEARNADAGDYKARLKTCSNQYTAPATAFRPHM